MICYRHMCTLTRESTHTHKKRRTRCLHDICHSRIFMNRPHHTSPCMQDVAIRTTQQPLISPTCLVLSECICSVYFRTRQNRGSDIFACICLILNEGKGWGCGNGGGGGGGMWGWGDVGMGARNNGRGWGQRKRKPPYDVVLTKPSVHRGLMPQASHVGD